MTHACGRLRMAREILKAARERTGPTVASACLIASTLIEEASDEINSIINERLMR
mgnify:CR=1 FL=1